MKLFERIKGIIKGRKSSAALSSGVKPAAEKTGIASRAAEAAADKSESHFPGRRRRGRSGRRRKDRERPPEHFKGAAKSGAEPAAGHKERQERGETAGKGQAQEQGQRGKVSLTPVRSEHDFRAVAATEKEGTRRGQFRKKHRHKKRKSELGGTAQRIEFPELLPVNEKSEEFVKNEFRPLGLSDRVVLALATNRFRTPTDIQKAVIPVALRGADLLGQAQTGTGKTVAFLMPIFDRMDVNSPAVKALIVVPTRELCRQVSWEAARFGRTLGSRVLSLYGGTSVSREIEHLKSGAQIVVGTPGRLLDHIFSANLDLSALKILVLDEADRMFDIGFRQDIIKIIKACPPDRQIMLLSATLDKEVEDLSRHYMKDPVKLYLSKDEITVESIWQRYITTDNRQKTEKLVRLLRSQKPTQSLIFTNTKKMSDALALRLQKFGFKVQCIHSDLSQNKREKVIDAFRTGQIEHLVATDVAARGLDITGISHVINYDIPENPEDYVHRVGRTGRMGAAGKAFTFVTPGEGKQLTQIEKLTDKAIEEWEEG